MKKIVILVLLGGYSLSTFGMLRRPLERLGVLLTPKKLDALLALPPELRAEEMRFILGQAIAEHAQRLPPMAGGRFSVDELVYILGPILEILIYPAFATSEIVGVIVSQLKPYYPDISEVELGQELQRIFSRKGTLISQKRYDPFRKALNKWVNEKQEELAKKGIRQWVEEKERTP